MKRFLLLVTIGVAALALGITLSILTQNKDGLLSQASQVKLKSGTVLLGQEKPVTDFSMTGIDGKPFTNEQLKGKWSYVYFGFTNCGYICPTSMKILSDAIRQLESQGQADDVQGVFISTDPERDSPSIIKAYVEGFHPKHVGATDNPEDLRKLTRQLGVIYTKIENPESPENYDMDHSSHITIVNPDGEFAAILSPPLTANNLADDLITIKSLSQ